MYKKEVIEELEEFLNYLKDTNISNDMITDIKVNLNRLNRLNIRSFKHTNDSIRELVSDWYNSSDRTPTSLLSKAIEDADVSEVTDMEGLFKFERSIYFNLDISSWDVSSVTNMSGIFENCENFLKESNSAGTTSFYKNIDISMWNVSNVRLMTGMFYNNYSFNQDTSIFDCSGSCLQILTGEAGLKISGWNVSSVTSSRYMFGSEYNQDIALIASKKDLSFWKIINPKISTGYKLLDNHTVTKEGIENYLIDLQQSLASNLQDNKDKKEQFYLIKNYKESISKIELNYPELTKELDITNLKEF